MLRENGAIDDFFSILKAPTINLAPVVNAGLDQSVESGQPIQLDASASDDGQPVGMSLNYNWQLLSGPGNAVFGDENALDTTVSFSATGSYQLQFSASDTLLADSDEITITITPDNTSVVPVTSSGSGSIDDVRMLAGLLLLLLLKFLLFRSAEVLGSMRDFSKPE